MKIQDTVYDFIGVGVGPFNLGLACLTNPIKSLKGIFFDQRDQFNWHPGMMMQNTTLQIPFMADLVTLADPTSPFSFLNYLKAEGRMYAFYIRENFLVLRHEYNLYCQWVLKQLDNVHFGMHVESIHYDTSASCYLVGVRHTQTGKRHEVKARRLVLGTGTAPFVPECCRDLDKSVHSAHYLEHKEALQVRKSITIVGGGQSAAEIYYDLLQDIDTCKYALHWITRSPRFFPLEYSKLTLEMTSPEYVDYFYQLPAQKRDHLIAHQKHLYKGINSHLIGDIFDLLYTKKLHGDIRVSLHTNAALQRARYDHVTDTYDLTFFQQEQEKHFAHQTEGLVLATGYTYRQPKCIDGIRDRIRWDDQKRYAVHRNYSIDHCGNEIFVQNAELHTHGFVTPDLGMACYRNSYIIREMLGEPYYPVEQSIAFQQFGVGEALAEESREQEVIHG